MHVHSFIALVHHDIRVAAVSFVELACKPHATEVGMNQAGSIACLLLQMCTQLPQGVLLWLAQLGQNQGALVPIECMVHAMAAQVPLKSVGGGRTMHELCSLICPNHLASVF